MTDRETLIALLEKMGLTRAEPSDDACMPPASGEFRAYDDRILVGSGDGYAGFYARFEFDEAGNITGHGIWE